MRPLQAREKRTIRWAAIAVAVYLVLFFGWRLWQAAERRRDQYHQLIREASNFKQKLQVYEDKAMAASNLMVQFRFDPARLSRTTMVAQVTAAIQQAAMSGGIQLASIRETPSRAAARELSAVQLEGMGPTPAILNFLHVVSTLGFPLITDSVQLSDVQPGRVKMNVVIVILDFDQWKAEEVRPNA